MSTEFAPLAFPVLRDDAARAAEERGRIQGHAAGYAAGRREAAAELRAEQAAREAEHRRSIAEGRERIASATAALSAGAAALAKATVPVLAAVDDALLAAAVELAEAILLHELRDAPGSALDRVRQAIAGSADWAPLRVRLAPADADLVGASIDGVQVASDPSLATGDVVVELPEGLLDARIPAALERARASLGGTAP